MNNTATIKYSLITSLKNVSIFYVTLLVLLVVFSSISLFPHLESSGLGMWDILAMIACSGVAACFKERFHFFVQNGYSRKTIFKNFIVTFICMSLFMCIVDLCITFLGDQGFIAYSSAFSSLYESANPNFFTYFLWHFVLNIFFFSIVFLISILFYRLSSTMKKIFFVIVPIVLVICIPVLHFLIPSLELFDNIFKVILWCLGLYETINPYTTIIFTTIATLILLPASYLILRKLDVQKM